MQADIGKINLMTNIFTKILELLKIYKWLLLLAVPILFFIGLLIYIFSAAPSSPPPTPSLTLTPTSSISEPSEFEEGDLENEIDENLELRPDFQKKETKNDGVTTYTFASGNLQRPNTMILTKDGELVFSRTLNSADAPIAGVSVLKESFGEPERIIRGSKSYGQQSEVYIYSSIGFVFIGNPQTDESLEEQHFPPMTADAYLQRFGDQN